MPNLFSLRPVVILACVPASTSGLTRMVMSAFTPSWPATAFSVSSSAELSTLIWPTPACERRHQLRRLLADAGIDDRLAGMPAASARLHLADRDDVGAGAQVAEQA